MAATIYFNRPDLKLLSNFGDENNDNNDNNNVILPVSLNPIIPNLQNITGMK